MDVDLRVQERLMIEIALEILNTIWSRKRLTVRYPGTCSVYRVLPTLTLSGLVGCKVYAYLVITTSTK